MFVYRRQKSFLSRKLCFTYIYRYVLHLGVVVYNIISRHLYLYVYDTTYSLYILSLFFFPPLFFVGKLPYGCVFLSILCVTLYSGEAMLLSYYVKS